MSDHPRLTDDRIDEIIGRDGAGARTDETLYLARELQERRASALPAVGDVERNIAISLVMTETDWDNLITREHAERIYDHPDSTGPHHGDCTKAANTCLRCVREDVDRRAKIIAAALSAAPSGDGREGGKERPELDALLAEARERVSNMSPEELEEMLRLQRESWARQAKD